MAFNVSKHEDLNSRRGGRGRGNWLPGWQIEAWDEREKVSGAHEFLRSSLC